MSRSSPGWSLLLLLCVAGCRASQPPPADGMKRLEVTEAQARSWGLPPSAFGFDYPAAAELVLAQPGRRNPFYAMVTLYKGEAMTESVTLCHADLRGGPASGWAALAPTVIATLQHQLRRQNASVTFAGTGEADFGGRKLQQFGFELEIKDRRQGEPGRYRGLWVARIPEAGDRSPNGVTFTMNVLEGSGSALKAKDDFATKGLPGQIWQSFHFAR